MEHLKTLNIRNLPVIDENADGFSLYGMHESLATGIVKLLRRHGKRLGVIGIGSTTWMDIWQGRSRQDGECTYCESYLCPRIFYVDYPLNLRGERQPLLTQIAQGTATEAKEYSSDLRIFEPYWLA